jgi:hypothetical protein
MLRTRVAPLLFASSGSLSDATAGPRSARLPKRRRCGVRRRRLLQQAPPARLRARTCSRESPLTNERRDRGGFRSRPEKGRRFGPGDKLAIEESRKSALRRSGSCSCAEAERGLTVSQPLSFWTVPSGHGPWGEPHSEAPPGVDFRRSLHQRLKRSAPTARRKAEVGSASLAWQLTRSVEGARQDCPDRSGPGVATTANGPAEAAGSHQDRQRG